MKANQFDLNYVKAAIETLDLIELFLIRLNNKNRINEFNSILQVLDIPSSDSIKDIRSAAK